MKTLRHSPETLKRGTSIALLELRRLSSSHFDANTPTTSGVKHEKVSGKDSVERAGWGWGCWDKDPVLDGSVISISSPPLPLQEDLSSYL